MTEKVCTEVRDHPKGKRGAAAAFTDLKKQEMKLLDFLKEN